MAVILLLLFWGSARAQMPRIPVDEKVKIGHLDNGLTYYIRHNNYPEHTASFYIVQKVGSINEDDDQRGLAHLLEHLAFNGTDHFKDNSLIDYLRSIGVEFSRNLNAFTGSDRTVYYFTDVPTTRATVVDSCMLILKDWSNGITLTNEAIEAERDVVHNEYRMRMVGKDLLLERNLPRLYQNEKYGYRMPIGLMSVVDGCSPKTLRAYYRKWYRPDNQAIIVVGDVDVDYIESKIKSLFADIKVPTDAVKVVPVTVSDNDTAIYVVDKSKEMLFDELSILMKREVTPDSLKGGMDYLVEQYTYNVISSMLNARIAEKAQEADCPFLQGGNNIGQYLFSRTKGVMELWGVVKSGKVKEAYAALLRELKRVHDFGFTATEYKRAMDGFMSGVESGYENRDKMQNEQFSPRYVEHFIANEPIPSVEAEYQMYKTIVPSVSVEMVNAVARQLMCQSDTNMVSIVSLKDDEDVVCPTEQELAGIVKQVRGEQLEAYVDNVKQEPLMATLPNAGKIKKTEENRLLGFKKLTLSNGAKVYIKKTDYKDDEIVFAAEANVGSSAFQDDPVNAVYAHLAWGVSGLGNFSNTEWKKALAGKQVDLNFHLATFQHGLRGNSTPKDLETLMQLIYLSMTSVSKDAKAFGNMKNTYVTVLANKSNNPKMVFSDSVQSTLYQGSKLFREPEAEDIKTLDYDRCLKMYKELYGNAKDFAFYFVGNYDEQKLMPLIEQYIASLPNKGMKVKNLPTPMASGEVKNIFIKEMENPQSQATEVWMTKMPFRLRTSVLADVAAQMLGMKYMRKIREQLSAAYATGVNIGSLFDYDEQFVIMLRCGALLNPDKADVAIPYFCKGMDETVASPDAADLQKAKEILLSQVEVNEKTNGYWLEKLSTLDLHKVDTHTDYKNLVKAVDAQQVSDFLKNVMLKSGNHFQIVMKAEKMK